MDGILVQPPKEKQDKTHRCPSLETRGCLSTPNEVHCLVVMNGQVGLGFDSFSIWSGPIPLTGSGRHQLAICIRDTMSVFSAMEQTQNFSGGKGDHWVLGGGGTWCPNHRMALLHGQGDTTSSGNTVIKIQNPDKCHSWRITWWTPVVQTRWPLPCFVSHPTP